MTPRPPGHVYAFVGSATLSVLDSSVIKKPAKPAATSTSLSVNDSRSRGDTVSRHAGAPIAWRHSIRLLLANDITRIVCLIEEEGDWAAQQLRKPLQANLYALDKYGGDALANIVVAQLRRLGVLPDA